MCVTRGLGVCEHECVYVRMSACACECQWIFLTQGSNWSMNFISGELRNCDEMFMVQRRGGPDLRLVKLGLGETMGFTKS